MFAEGQLLENKYRIGRLIGQGGMGAVYEAEAVLLRRRVAIKVQSFSHGSVAQTSGEMAMRFQLEAQAAGRIGSRHIVDVIDLGRLESGEHYMVMEYLDGQSLRERIDARGGMTAQEAYPIAQQLLVGLSAAHAAGIVHRDLKPENVFLVRQADGSDFVKILDFGISKFNDIRGSQGSFSLTRTGALMGTPRYLSPEQATGGKAVDQRTDIYMVGVILYECLTGSIPYEANTFNELLFQIVQDQPRPIRERVPGADPNFAALVECAMQKDPKARFQSADEMSAALQAVARGERFSTRPPLASGDSAAPALVPSDAPIARLSNRSGMAPPPNESAAKSWSQSHAGALRETGPAAPSSGKLRWILAAGAVVLAGVASATALKLRSSDGVVPSAVAVDDAAKQDEARDSVPAAAPPPAPAPPPVAPVGAPGASVTVVAPATTPPTTPPAGATRRDAKSSVTRKQTAPKAAEVAAKSPESPATSAAPAPSTNLQRVQGAGRIIRGNL